MCSMGVMVEDPVLVATSAPGETRWGFHQFPALSRMPDGALLLTYTDAEDASETHGLPAPCRISRDGGASWTPWDGALRPVRPHFTVSRVLHDEYLIVPSAPYLDVEACGIELPEPVAQGNTYGTVYTYRWSELPPAAQDYFRHLPGKRWRPQTRQWEEERIAYDMEGLLAWRREGSRLLPRTFFERAVLRHGRELLYADYRARYACEDGSVEGKGFTTLMVSRDNGRSFQRRSTVARDPRDQDLMGEPQLSHTADGRIVCVIRRTDQAQKPMGITWSADDGHRWTPLRDLFSFGVWPCVLLLDNGVLVLSYGRPGVHLAFARDGCGETWSDSHALIPGDPAAVQKHSCGYTSLMPLDQESFLIAYSDFLYPGPGGKACKAILTRRVRVQA